MPRKCSVPGCRSNYRNEPYTSIFNFPTDQIRKTQWIRAIQRDFVPGKNAGICKNHFNEKYLSTEDRIVRDDGTILVANRNVPKLLKDAVPSIFTNQPAYMSTNPSIKRKDPTVRQKEIENKIETKKRKKEEEAEEKDKIVSYLDFKTKYKSYIQITNILIIEKENSTLFVKVDTNNELPKIVYSCEINSQLQITTSCNDIVLETKKFKSILGDNLCCDRWSKLNKLLNKLLLITSEISALLRPE